MPVDSAIKILVVEDSKITRKMEIKILKQLGFENILEADDGEDAVVKLNADPDIGLIISDWNMPNKSGYDLLVWVRASERCRNIPFILATAQSEKRQTIKATEAGVSAFVSKPFAADELQRVLEGCFAEKPSDAAADMPETTYAPQMQADGKLTLRVAHIQITDHLVLGVLKHQIDHEKVVPACFSLETRCMPGWNPVQEAIETGRVDAAFILAPIAMDLFSFGVPIRLILFAHKNGSISVKAANSGDPASLQDFFRGKTFYIPHILSIHHMLTTLFLRELGLKPGMAGKSDVDTFFEIVPPVKMPEFLANNPDAGGFSVAEPLGTKAIAAGSGELLFLSGELWEYHPCCVLVVREEIVSRHPEAVQELTDLLVQSGQFMARHPEKAAEIGIDFLDPEKQLGLNVAVLRNVLKEPEGIKTDDLFPSIADLDRIQHYMTEQMGVGTLIDLEKFVDLRFAENACRPFAHNRHASVFHDVKTTVQRLVQSRSREGRTKTRLDREGKYLIFSLDGQDYGIGIDTVVEIIGMMPIRSIPEAPEFVKGVINLRGRIIPVIDLRLKFDLAASEYEDRTCIIILELPSNNGRPKKIGVTVDAVAEVQNIKAADIEDAPSFGMQADTDFILAMAKTADQVKILLDARRMFPQSEVQAIELVT